MPTRIEQFAVTCNGWRWMPGMLVRRDGRGAEWRLTHAEEGLAEQGWLPDLTDPATVGCLLALCIERRQQSAADVGALAVALITALETAP